MDELTAWSRDLSVEVAGDDVVNHAGSAAVRLLADRWGLTAGLSAALARDGFAPVHDRGRVLVDTAVLAADGGRVLCDLAALRDQAGLYGPVASDATLWRTLNEIGGPERVRIARARARTREHVWSLIEARHGRIPASRVADRDLGATVVIRMDASLVTAHSDKELAAGTFKGGFGHHPLTAWCDNTGESLALGLGRATPDRTPPRITSRWQTPRSSRSRPGIAATCWSPWTGRGPPMSWSTTSARSTPRPDAGCTTASGGNWAPRERAAIAQVPERAWDTVLDTQGAVRERDEAGVVELTGLTRCGPGGDQLAGWPGDLRLFCRRERPCPGAQLSLLEEADGWRYQVIATNSPGAVTGPRGPASPTRPRRRPHPHRQGHRPGASAGLGHLPSASARINRAWCVAAALACDLLCWLRLLCLDGPAEPKTLRYAVLHTAAKIVRGQRKRKLRIPSSWPWATALRTCFRTIVTLPRPG